MQQNNAPAAPAPSPAALKALQDAIGKAEAWQHRMGGLIQQIAHDVANPAKSMYHLWSFQLLPTADLSEAEVHLQAAVAVEGHLARAIDDMKKPDFLKQDKAQIERTGHQVSDNMVQARQEIRMAANAVYDANMKVLDRDVGIASGFVAADKFIVDKAPEVMGDIMFVITDGNEHARAATINVGKTALNGVEHVAANAEGVKLDKSDVRDFSEVALEAAIDEIADWVPEGKGVVKKVLTEMFKDICVEIAKNCPGKHGKDLQAAVLKAVNDGLMEAVKHLVKDIPALKDSKLADKLLKPVLSAAIAFEKSIVDDHKTAGEAGKDALKAGGEAVLLMGAAKVTHNAKDYHEPGSASHPDAAHPAHAHQASAHPAPSHAGHAEGEHSHGEHGRHEDHGHPDHGHPDHEHAHHEHAHHEHGHHEHDEHHANHGHHGHEQHAHAHSGATQAVKDAWLKEHFQFDVTAHAVPARS